MAPGRDDDALAWDGDDDPTLDVGPAPSKPIDDEPTVAEPDAPATTEKDEPEGTDATPAALPQGFTAVGKGSDEVGRVNRDGTVTMPDDRRPMGNATLISLGMLGGVYVIYAVGWIIGGLRLQGRAQYLVTDMMYQGSLWLAVLAPVLWFATVFLLTMRSRGVGEIRVAHRGRGAAAAMAVHDDRGGGAMSDTTTDAAASATAGRRRGWW